MESPCSFSNLATIVLAVATVAMAVAAIITAVVVCRYTRETRRLREAAQKQNEIGVMPIVALDFRSKEWKLEQTLQLLPPRIHNLGYGPAFDVRVGPMSQGPHKVEFDPVPLLPVGVEVDLRFTVSENGRLSGGASQLSWLAHVFDRGSFGAKTPVSIAYTDCTGKPYESKHLVQHERLEKLVATIYMGFAATGRKATSLGWPG